MCKYNSSLILTYFRGRIVLTIYHPHLPSLFIFSIFFPYSFQGREEELRQALAQMDLMKGGPDQALNRAAIDKALGAALEQRENVEGKLTSLEKYTSRLEGVSDWLITTKAKLLACSDASQRSKIQAEVADREAEVKEVLGNFTNLEKECQVVEQAVSPQLQVSFTRC